MRLCSLSSWAAKIAFAIFCADFLTMLLMNTLRLYTQWLPVLFFSLLAATGIWIFRSNLLPTSEPSYLSVREQRLLLFVVGAVLLIFAGMRLPYLLEGSFHHLVGPVVYDDTWHFSEINSLVNSIRYPAHYSLIPSQYFSLYYAPWMLIAALYLAFPVHGFTIKAAFAIGCTIYQVLVCLTLLYVGMNHARSRRHFYWALYLIGCWAGISSLFALIVPMQHNSFWMACFGMQIELFNYFVLSTWAIHHLSATGAIVLCWHIWDISKKKDWRVIACSSVLISYAFYSSVFVFLGALPMGIFVASLSLRKHWKSVLVSTGLAGALIWPLLWIYLGKPHKIGFIIPFISGIQFTSKRFPFVSAISGGEWAGFFLFIILLCCNFFPHVLALIFRGKELDWHKRILIAMAIGFLLSTYFIGFPEGNSYASRGSIIPVMVLGWICAELLPGIRIRALVAIGLLLGALGSIQEAFWVYTQTIQISRTSLGGHYSESILKINQDRHMRTIPEKQVSAAVMDYPYMNYYIEKFVPGGKHPLVMPDYELACNGPHGLWRWQKITEASDLP